MDKEQTTNPHTYTNNSPNNPLSENHTSSSLPPQPRIPRSAASISYALDQLDKELEADEPQSRLPTHRSSSSFDNTDTPTSRDGDDAAIRVDIAIKKMARLLAAETMTSHPLDFTSQYPSISIITTAALPWLTGTAVNPALRAAYLWHRGHAVSLLVPWIDPKDQPRLFPEGIIFHSQEEQKEAVQIAIQRRVPFQLPNLVLIPSPIRCSASHNDSQKGNSMSRTTSSDHLSHRDGQCLSIDRGRSDNSIIKQTSHDLSSEQSMVYTNTTRTTSTTSAAGKAVLQSMHSNASPNHCFSLVFYHGRYDAALGSIIPEEDLQSLVPLPVDCIILEEPEHLTWYHSGKRWTRAFPPAVPVIGIMHTNYVDYARRMAGDAAASTLKRLNKFLCRMHTHKVIKLSDAVQTLPRQETCFVHGVSEAFLQVGTRSGRRADDSACHERSDGGVAVAVGLTGDDDLIASVTSIDRFSKGLYFLGKALWAKGFAELIERVSEYTAHCRDQKVDAPTIDVYGKGEELQDITTEASMRNLPMSFLGAKDHLSPDMAEYRGFINPSTSDVVATTSAEALAMGKWLIVPKHPCNAFFSTFSNCLMYSTPKEFASAIDRSLVEDPAPLTTEEERRLTWEAATDRFLHCCASVEMEKGPPLERVAVKTGWVGYNVGYHVYSVVTGAIESVRKALARDEEGAAKYHISGGNSSVSGGAGSRSLGGVTIAMERKVSSENIASHALRF